MRLHSALIAGVMLFAFPLASPALAQTVLLHLGNVDPTTEGWMLSGGVAGPTDNGGTPAWHVQEGGTYTQMVPADMGSMLWYEGWTLSVMLRNLSSDAALSAGVYLVLHGGGYHMQSGRRANGDLYVKMISGEPDVTPLGPEYAIAGDPYGYHRYDLVRTPGPVNQVSLYVDGVLAVANHPGFIAANPSLTHYFHASSSLFSHLELRVGNDLPVPAEPASWGAVKAHYRGADTP